MDSRKVFSEKSFEALITASEAFALQKSVISNPNIVPASAETVAQVVAQYSNGQLSRSMADSPTDFNGRSSPASATAQPSSAGDARREPIRYPAVAVTTIKEKGGVYAKPKEKPAVSNQRVTAAIGPVKSLPTSAAASASSGKPVSRGSPQMPDVNAKQTDAAALHTSFREAPSRDLDTSVFNAEYNVDGKPLSTVHPLQTAEGLSGPVKAADMRQQLTPTENPTIYALHVSAAHTPPPLLPVSPAASAASWTGEAERAWSVDASAYERLAKEKANLEGRVETLVEEAEAAMRERVQLQAELAAARLQLAQQQTSQAMVPAASAVDGERQHQRLLLEARAAELQVAADASSVEARHLADELRAARAGSERLREAAAAALADVATRERLIGELRASLETARGDVGRADEHRLRAEDDLRRTLDELGALGTARDWYQQQLHVAQETRSQLQTEVTKLQNHTAAQTDALERLRVENAQLKHQLGETQHKTLAEKQLLMRHLEAIEADMVEREAGIDQIQREQNLTELTARQRLLQAEKERMQLGKLAAAASELEHELQRARHELDAARAEVDVLEGQRAELGRRLVATQDELAIRSRDVEQLRETSMETESRLKSALKKDIERDAQLTRIKEEKDKIEVALRSALEEKKAFSSAVEALKGNAAKVEANFKLMRQEVASKSRELELAAETSNRLQKELDEARAGRSAATLVTAERDVTRTVVMPQLSTGADVDVAQRDAALAELRLHNHSLVAELDGLRHDLAVAQQREQVATADRFTLEQHYAAAHAHALQLEHATHKLSAVKAELEGQLQEAREQLDRSQRQLLSEDNDTMKKTCDDLQEKVTVLASELGAAQQSLRDCQMEYQATVALLNQQLKEAIGSRDRAFKELMSVSDDDRTKASAAAIEQQRQEQLQVQVKLLQADLSEAQKRKAELEWLVSEQQAAARAAAEEFRLKAAVLEQTIAEARDRSAQQRDLGDDYRQLELELEKEKGRLAGVRQHHDKLKQHVREVEAALARRESSAVELSASSLQAIRRQDELLEEQRIKLSEQEEAARHEQAAAADLRAQLTQALDCSSKYKQQLEATKSELLQLKHAADRSALELVSVTAELERAKQVEERQVASLQALHTEHRSSRLEAEQLRRVVAETAARAPIINDEIKALHWQIKQKNKEVNDLENQVKLTENRLLLETENMKKALTVSNTDTETLRLELAATRKDKFSYQAKVGELRVALKAVVQQAKGSNEECKLDVEHLEKVVEDTAVPSYKSKPLQNLKSCLASLQTEMQALQQQMAAPPEPPDGPAGQGHLPDQ